MQFEVDQNPSGRYQRKCRGKYLLSRFGIHLGPVIDRFRKPCRGTWVDQSLSSNDVIFVLVIMKYNVMKLCTCSEMMFVCVSYRYHWRNSCRATWHPRILICKARTKLETSDILRHPQTSDQVAWSPGPVVPRREKGGSPGPGGNRSQAAQAAQGSSQSFPSLQSFQWWVQRRKREGRQRWSEGCCWCCGGEGCWNTLEGEHRGSLPPQESVNLASLVLDVLEVKVDVWFKCWRFAVYQEIHRCQETLAQGSWVHCKVQSLLLSLFYGV